MSSTPELPTHRVYAELPSGQILIPGTSTTCPGPDAFGACPLGQGERPCEGAAWCYSGSAGWRCVFRAGSSVCPVVVLDPLGPLPTPLD